MIYLYSLRPSEELPLKVEMHVSHVVSRAWNAEGTEFTLTSRRMLAVYRVTLLLMQGTVSFRCAREKAVAEEARGRHCPSGYKDIPQWFEEGFWVNVSYK